MEQQQNQLLFAHIAGHHILDLGCGYGGLTAYLQQKKLTVIGVDLEKSHILEGQKRFVEADLRVMDAEHLSFPDQSFDTVILRESLHHFLHEAAIENVMQEITRITRKRILVMDPNPTFILRICRKIIQHIDPECSPKEAQALLQRFGFSHQRLFFFEGFALALSGGYVGVPLVPSIPQIYPLLLKADQFYTRSMNRMGLGKTCLWRYLLRADRVEESDRAS